MKALRLAAAVAALALAAAGCGEDSTEPDGGAASANGGVDLAAAERYIEPYTKPSTRFPVTEPLKKRPKPGSTVVFLDIGTPVTALVWQYLQPTADLLGIKLRRVKTGNDAESINAALNSVLESRPAGVIDIALDPTFFTPQLEEMKKRGIAFLPASIVNGEKFGFDDASILGGRSKSIESGKILAAAILVQTKGKAKEFVFYNVPELPFSNLQQQGAKEQMAALCPTCTLRTVDIPIAKLGTTAPQAVVSDLQAHPETDAFITALDEIQIGLPAAMRVAGLDVPGLGQNPALANFKQVAAGEQLGTFYIDTHMYTWMGMDQLVRKMAGEEVQWVDDRSDLSVYRLIFKDDVPADPTKTSVVFPDYRERFAKLWGAAGT